MSRQTFSDEAMRPLLKANTAINTFTAETNMWTASLQSAIPAFAMATGDCYELDASGVLGTTGTPTLIITPRFGQSTTPASNITFGASNTITMGSGLTAVPWRANFRMVCRDVGLAAAGSTLWGVGFMSWKGVAGAVDQDVTFGGTLITTADHSTNQGLILSATWGTSAAGNTITTNFVNIRRLN